MSRPRHHPGARQAAEALARTAPLVSRWIERLLAAHDPPLTVAQYLALEAVAEGEMVGAELARRARPRRLGEPCPTRGGPPPAATRAHRTRQVGFALGADHPACAARGSPH